jgi:hypothetical protein
MAQLGRYLLPPTPDPTKPARHIDLGAHTEAVVLALVVGILVLAGMLGWAVSRRRA